MVVIVLVCLIGQPCDTTTARAFQSYRAPPGFAVCGLPGMLPLQSDALAAQDGEETHIRCSVGKQ